MGPSEALVYIYRPAGFFGSGMRPDVKIDGVLIGTLSVGSYMVKPLAAGTHQLLLTGNGNFLKWNYADRVVQIDARPGSTLYFRYTASSNMVNASTMALGYTFQAVSEATALEEMTELNRVE